MDRNKAPAKKKYRRGASPPARVAGIETVGVCHGGCLLKVATREGGVDRNPIAAGVTVAVALVATREGGVDRNSVATLLDRRRNRSPPARVAWIETSSFEI